MTADLSPLSKIEAAPRATRISMRYVFAPLEYILCDLSAIIGNFVEELLGAFYPRIVSKRANVLLTELVGNVLENISDPNSEIELSIDIDEDTLSIRIRNATSPEQYALVADHVSMIRNTDDLRALMKKTIRERREKRAKGGLGLIRVAAESKFDLTTDYVDGYLVIDAKMDVGGLL
ncbi:MAG: ATP-binding protein [Alphaproteobacteria bacterium]|nr:ATP-binding protein [Alphaproteobacteria bacterium]